MSLFRQAGLLEEPPDDDTVDWWAGLSGAIRQQADKQRNDRARAAERLSLQHETERLRGLGVDVRPRWMAVEDNTVGYDILSYEVGQYGLINKLIEVKSTIASPLRFYVTRNEWESALRYGEAFWFQIWDMNRTPPVLYVRSVADVAPHIPADNKKGKWQNAQVPVAL